MGWLFADNPDDVEEKNRVNNLKQWNNETEEWDKIMLSYIFDKELLIPYRLQSRYQVFNLDLYRLHPLHFCLWIGW